MRFDELKKRWASVIGAYSIRNYFIKGNINIERTIRMTDDERFLLISIFLAVFITFAIAAYFCLE